jgi:hypothetical protein
VFPLSSTPGLIDAMRSMDKRNLIFSSGYIGVAVSSGAHKKLWARVGKRLSDRDQ